MPEITRVSSGIPGLDEMIMGGFPKPSAILIAGEPGTGKTTFSVQSLFYGAKKGETCVYITAISEPQWVVQRFLSTFKFFEKTPIEKGKIVFIDLGRNLMENPRGILSTMKAKIEKYNPDRLVIDPITPIKNAWEKSGETRELLHELLAYLKAFNCTSLLTAELTYTDIPRSLEGYMVDGIIVLSYPEIENVRRKYLEVLKMRGTKHITGRQLVDITTEGFSVQPGLR
ncbi:MAG: ATPase domain-containing protein [Thermoplasmata archaeon]